MECKVEIKEEFEEPLTSLQLNTEDDTEGNVIPKQIYTDSPQGKNVYLQCPYCDYKHQPGYIIEKFKYHMLTTHASKIRDCLNCGNPEFTDVTKQIEHIIDCLSRSAQESLLSDSDNSRELLRSQFLPAKNLESDVAKNYYTCNICNRRMKENQVPKHADICQRDTEFYRCAIGRCLFKGRTRSEVEYHKVLEHTMKTNYNNRTKKKEDGECSIPAQTIIFKCPLCDGKFWGQIQLSNHIKTMHFGVPKAMVYKVPDSLIKEELKNIITGEGSKASVPNINIKSENTKNQIQENNVKQTTVVSKKPCKMTLKFDKYTYRCPLCIFNTPVYPQFFKHLDAVHPEEKDTLSPHYCCFKCGQIFTTLPRFFEHQKKCKDDIQNETNTSQNTSEADKDSLSWDRNPAIKRKRDSEDDVTESIPPPLSVSPPREGRVDVSSPTEERVAVSQPTEGKVAVSPPREGKGKVVKCAICYQTINHPVEDHIQTHKVMLKDQEVFRCPCCPMVARKLKTLLYHIQTEHKEQMAAKQKSAKTNTPKTTSTEVNSTTLHPTKDPLARVDSDNGQELTNEVNRSPLTKSQMHVFKSLFSNGHRPPAEPEPTESDPLEIRPSDTLVGAPAIDNPPVVGSKSTASDNFCDNSNSLPCANPVESDSSSTNQDANIQNCLKNVIKNTDKPKIKQGGRNKAAVNSDDEGSDTSAEASEQESDYEEIELIAKNGKKRWSKQFQCEVCSLKFTNKIKYYRHIGSLYGTAAINKRPELSCDLCPELFKTKSVIELDNHKQNNHIVIIRVCPFCPQFKTSLPKIFNHHMKTSQHVTRKCDLACSMCPLSFKNLHNLRGHLFSRHNVKTGLQSDCLFYVRDLSAVLERGPSHQ